MDTSYSVPKLYLSDRHKTHWESKTPLWSLA